jgi:hypothetical protein
MILWYVNYNHAFFDHNVFLQQQGMVYLYIILGQIKLFNVKSGEPVKNLVVNSNSII